MMTLYFSPGACSLASHIGLEESGAAYEAKPVLLAKQQQRTEGYLKINPRGKVPSLDADGKILVENTAILTYLARRFPEKKLMPSDPLEEARCIATMCWFSSIVHPSFQRCMRPERFADGEAAVEAEDELLGDGAVARRVGRRRDAGRPGAALPALSGSHQRRGSLDLLPRPFHLIQMKCP